jgi:hypothetical protein
MSYRFLALASALAVSLAGPVSAQTPGAKAKNWTMPRTADSHPDLQGIWTNVTITTLERPAALGSASSRSREAASGSGDLALVPRAPAAGQRDRMIWERFLSLVGRRIPSAKILHPHPNVRFDAMHPR